MAQITKKGPQKGSLRVAAWIHTVINPLIEALQIERGFLEKHNWTWRYYNNTLEFIKPLRNYLNPPSWPNLDDLLRANPSLNEPLQSHDKLLSQLKDNCQKAFQFLQESIDFQEKVDNLLKQYREEYKEKGYPGGAGPEGDFSKLVAERIINKIEEMPPYYTDSFFLSLYGKALLSEFRVGKIFEVLDASGAQLNLHDQSLIRILEDLRFELCEKYDVPAAPAPMWEQKER
jgi:hypothetical protein